MSGSWNPRDQYRPFDCKSQIDEGHLLNYVSYPCLDTVISWVPSKGSRRHPWRNYECQGKGRGTWRVIVVVVLRDVRVRDILVVRRTLEWLEIHRSSQWCTFPFWISEDLYVFLSLDTDVTSIVCLRRDVQWSYLNRISVSLCQLQRILLYKLFGKTRKWLGIRSVPMCRCFVQCRCTRWQVINMSYVTKSSKWSGVFQFWRRKRKFLRSVFRNSSYEMRVESSDKAIRRIDCRWLLEASALTSLLFTFPIRWEVCFGVLWRTNRGNKSSRSPVTINSS